MGAVGRFLLQYTYMYIIIIDPLAESLVRFAAFFLSAMLVMQKHSRFHATGIIYQEDEEVRMTTKTSSFPNYLRINL